MAKYMSHHTLACHQNHDHDFLYNVHLQNNPNRDKSYQNEYKYQYLNWEVYHKHHKICIIETVCQFQLLISMTDMRYCDKLLIKFTWHDYMMWPYCTISKLRQRLRHWKMTLLKNLPSQYFFFLSTGLLLLCVYLEKHAQYSGVTFSNAPERGCR